MICHNLPWSNGKTICHHLPLFDYMFGLAASVWHDFGKTSIHGNGENQQQHYELHFFQQVFWHTFQ
jgi:hypothetical protein